MKLFYFISILLISSCAIFLAEHERPAINGIEIHDNPKAGDFAILEDTAQGFKSTWRVDKVEGKRVFVSFIWEFKSANFSKRSHYLMTVTKSGKVLNARFKYDDNNIKNQPVATPGGQNSRLDYVTRAVPTPITASTTLGNIDIHNISSFGLYSEIGGIARSENSFISELSNDVPFKVVKMYVINTIQKGITFTSLEHFESLLTLAAAENPINAYDRAFKSLLGEKDDDVLEIEYTLTSFGRGK